MSRRFLFEVTEDDNGKLSFRSVGDGFKVFEVLGFLEWKRVDLFNQLSGEVKPTQVSRSVVVNALPENERRG